MKFILALLLTSTSIFSADIERLDVDPVLQGIWIASHISEDEGKTVTNINEVLARMNAVSVRMPDGNVYNVQRVLISTTDDGKTCNKIYFSNTTTAMAVSETNMPGAYLLQMFDGRNGYKELLRYLITVRQ